MVDYGKKEKDEENIYDRNFYKVLIMRILFTQNYIIEGLKMNEVDDIVNEIFGKEGKYFIEKIKDMFFKYDEFGKRKSYNNNEYLERYKNVSKILSVIEVDVMNYLIKRVFNGICNREFYVNIFDGFLIKKKNYEVLKCEVNMILRNEVGYMFYMK
jgi:predicted GNAT superfamily acetyltransferase